MDTQNIDKKYIQRDLEVLNTINVDLSRVSSDDAARKSIYNLHGIAGIGKTYVIQQIFDIFQKMYDVIWLDFKGQSDINTPMQNSDQLNLKYTTWTNMFAILETVPALKGHLPEQVIYDDKLSLPLEHMDKLLLQHSLDGTFQRPLLLLLDSLDNLPYWKWFQEQIIKPLIELRHTIIVCVSRAPLNWHYWELRESCESYEIPSFTKLETHKFLTQSHRGLLSETIYKLAGGYPLALQQFVHMLDAPVAVMQNRYALPPIQLEQLQPKTREVLLRVGVMRRVNIEIMQDLLEDDQILSTQQLRLMLREIREQNLIQSYHDTSDRFIPELRAWLRNATDRAEYLECCKIIADRYYEIAKNQPKTEDTAIIEWVFFSTEPFDLGEFETQLEWQTKLRELRTSIQRVYALQSHLAPNLVKLLYLDGELLDKLFRLDLLSNVHEEILSLFQYKQLSLQREVGRACSKTLEILGERFMGMTHDDFVSFETTLRNLRPAGELVGFNQDELRENITNQWPALEHRPTRSLNELIVLMSGDGILQYDRKQRLYRFHPVIDQLLSVEGRERISVKQAA